MTLRTLAATAILTTISVPALAQVPSQAASYSGQMEYRGEGRVQVANVYGAPMKSRIDMSVDGTASTFIIDLASNTALTYGGTGAEGQNFAMKMDMSGVQDRLGPTYDSGKAATRVGSDVVAGERCDLYRQDDTTICMTSDGILLRARNDKGDGMEMRRLQRGPQPAHYFQIPAGYTVMDMSGMAGALGGMGLGGHGSAGGHASADDNGFGEAFGDSLSRRASGEARYQTDRAVRDAAGNSVGGRIGGGAAGDALGEEAGKLIGGLFGKRKKKKAE